jgi:crotonobetainyl-CoA:carnitine CoA-transferase CaiB-like acyl-CoA transferase
VRPQAALASLWQQAGLAPEALPQLRLTGQEPLLPSSFAIATALQASLGAAALAAAQLGHWRGGPAQQVNVNAADVVCEASACFQINGQSPPIWEKYSGLYPCGDALGAPGHVRIHANFAHHRDGALALLGLPAGTATERAELAEKLCHWRAEDLEQAAADAGLVVAALRSPEAWAAHPQAAAVAAQPLLGLTRLDNAPATALPRLTQPGQPPLQGLRVLDLTRILAGPVAGRTLAAYGADVMLVNSPRLPNIAALADTSRGKLSVQLDLTQAVGRDTLRELVREADVLVQSYRPGALAALGFGTAALAALRPGLVVVNLSAYGGTGPWAGRRGFDSLVQTATGFNAAEAHAFGQTEPRALPLQVLDYSAGFLLAFGALAALLRQAQAGGSWRVDVNLARTGLWLRSLGRLQRFAAVQAPDPRLRLDTSSSGFGQLSAVRHAARLSATPAGWARPAMPPGSHAPQWPARAAAG